MRVCQVLLKDQHDVLHSSTQALPASASHACSAALHPYERNVQKTQQLLRLFGHKYLLSLIFLMCFLIQWKWAMIDQCQGMNGNMQKHLSTNLQHSLPGRNMLTVISCHLNWLTLSHCSARSGTAAVGTCYTQLLAFLPKQLMACKKRCVACAVEGAILRTYTYCCTWHQAAVYHNPSMYSTKKQLRSERSNVDTTKWPHATCSKAAICGHHASQRPWHTDRTLKSSQKFETSHTAAKT